MATGCKGAGKEDAFINSILKGYTLFYKGCLHDYYHL